MKVQINSKSEPKFPKRDDSKLFYFLSHKREKLVLIFPKSESDIKEETAQTKAKTELCRKEKAMIRKFQILIIPFFYFNFLQIIIYVQLVLMP